jgi:hypothetical protein
MRSLFYRKEKTERRENCRNKFCSKQFVSETRIKIRDRTDVIITQYGLLVSAVHPHPYYQTIKTFKFTEHSYLHSQENNTILV